MAHRSLAWAVFFLTACAGPSIQQKKTLAELQAAGDFRAAAESVRASQEGYGAANLALYHLDLAQALADAGAREEADLHFAKAQARMEELWTLSVAKRTGAAVANENVDDYRGADFERALSHVLRAMNLIAMGRFEGALVEIKRVEAFLDEVARAAPRARAYRDDAFARWLAAMLYEELDKPDDSRISGEAAHRAYTAYGRVYGTVPPLEPAGRGESEIVFIGLEGPAPRKVRRSGYGPLGLLLNSSYPAYEEAPALIAQVEVSIGKASARASVAADIGAIAAADLQERIAELKVRSNLRAALKILGSVTGIQSQDSEFADVRCWATAPARIRVARLRVAARAPEIRVRYLDASGQEVSAESLPVHWGRGTRAWVISRNAR